jgi:hypothetical protein
MMLLHKELGHIREMLSWMLNYISLIAYIKNVNSGSHVLSIVVMAKLGIAWGNRLNRMFLYLNMSLSPKTWISLSWHHSNLVIWRYLADWAHHVWCSRNFDVTPSGGFFVIDFINGLVKFSVWLIETHRLLFDLSGNSLQGWRVLRVILSLTEGWRQDRSSMVRIKNLVKVWSTSKLNAWICHGGCATFYSSLSNACWCRGSTQSLLLTFIQILVSWLSYHVERIVHHHARVLGILIVRKARFLT